MRQRLCSKSMIVFVVHPIMSVLQIARLMVWQPMLSPHSMNTAEPHSA